MSDADDRERRLTRAPRGSLQALAWGASGFDTASGQSARLKSFHHAISQQFSSDFDFEIGAS